MANHSSMISAISLTLLFLSCLFKSFNAAGIGVYWGQDSSEGGILDACKTSNYKYLSIAFLSSFGGGKFPELSLSHCDTKHRGDCWPIGAKIKDCQSLGIKVFLSIGDGGGGNYTLSSADDAREVAKYLKNYYLTGKYGTQIFGDAVLDGIEFNIQGAGSNLYWDVLAQALKEDKKDLLLAATPQCLYPDSYLNAAIDTGLFDYIWVKFYNDVRCQYPDQNIQFLVDSLVAWSNKLSDNGQVFLNLPAAKEAAQSGYIPPDYLNSTVIPAIHDSISSKFGGVMLWNRLYDGDNKYSDTIKPYIDNLPPTKASF